MIYSLPFILFFLIDVVSSMFLQTSTTGPDPQRDIHGPLQTLTLGGANADKQSKEIWVY